MSDLRLRLKPERIAVAGQGLLLHQQESCLALKNSQVVMNCAPTGAGKTKAGHLAVKEYAEDLSVLFIAPTNALVAQHLEDARAFVKANGLPHKVVAVDGSVLYFLLKKRPEIYRPSDVLHQLIFNPREFSEELELSDTSGPLFLVTNPDQIWLSIIKGRERDTRNLLTDFINSFRFVVVDEFHYYNAQQLVLFFLCAAFWKHFGQFDHGLKLLLLTATPDEMVLEFFKRLDLHPVVVGLENENSIETIPVLSPIELTLTTRGLMDYVDHVAKLYNKGKDGVIISDSLREINTLYRQLEQLNLPVGRITGPINNKRRKLESKQPIILATPTVDLGFNFIKPKIKYRQEIDFIIARARNKSAFWQRLGRAGRVLGKKETDIPSEAIMILSDSGRYSKAKKFAGRELERRQLKKLMGLNDSRLTFAALTREGLYTATRQLVEIERMVKGVDENVVEQIFESLKKCMDPKGFCPASWDSFRKRHWLMGQLKELEEKKAPSIPKQLRKLPPLRIMKENEDSRRILLFSWAKDFFYRRGQLAPYMNCSDEQKVDLIETLLKQPNSKKMIFDYHREQILRFEYLFDFRGSRKEKKIWVYDPEGLHSPDWVKQIDVIRLLSDFKFDYIQDRATAQQNWKTRLPGGNFFCRLADFLEYPYVPVYTYPQVLPDPPDIRENEPELPELLPFFWRTKALHNLSVDFANKKIGSLAVPPGLSPMLKDISELFFITPIENEYALLNMLKDYDVLTAKLKCKTQSGREVEYAVVPGKNAIIISEELYFRAAA